MKSLVSIYVRHFHISKSITKMLSAFATVDTQYSTDQRRVHTWVASPDTPPPSTVSTNITL